MKYQVTYSHWREATHIEEVEKKYRGAGHRIVQYKTVIFLLLLFVSIIKNATLINLLEDV